LLYGGGILSNLFSALEVEEHDGVVEGESKTNEEMAEFLKTNKKEAVKTYIAKEVRYPMIEIILDEESRLDVIRKEALDDMLIGEIRDIDANDILESVKHGGIFDEITIAMSYKEKFSVRGTLRRSQLSHFYSLVVDMKMKLHISEDEIYAKERILAII
jgi:hypothetical protein